jgi:hypothetical protein
MVKIDAGIFRGKILKISNLGGKNFGVKLVPSTFKVVHLRELDKTS